MAVGKPDDSNYDNAAQNRPFHVMMKVALNKSQWAKQHLKGEMVKDRSSGSERKREKVKVRER